MAIPRKRPKILIIEDETITAHNLSRILARLGYEVVSIATTGAQALEDVERYKPDLLLADVGLEGELDGISVAAQAQERWKIPAVFLTAFTDSETIRRARLAEPYGYLVKPFGEQELHATIEIALQQRGIAAERQQQTMASARLLERTQEELAAATAQAFRSQEEERERIARDLHDDFAQRLALLQIEIEGIEQSLPAEFREAQKRGFGSVRQSLEKLGNNLRELSHHLHPSILDHLGLPNALRQLGGDFRDRHAMEVRVTWRNIPQSVPPPVSLALYRIAQEALTNVSKHAAGASVKIVLTGSRRGLDLSIRDSGSGFDIKNVKAGGGLGLISMAQRAGLLGGTFELHSEPGQGTQIRVRVPLSQRKRKARGGQAG